MSASFIMTKRKTQKPKNPDQAEATAPFPTPRRSIPVVKAARTIYDDRTQILNQLEGNEGEIEYHEGVLHRLRLENKTIRSDLTRINLAITRQLELDGE